MHRLENMMKNRKRMLALLLSLVLVASLCACSGEPADGSESLDPSAAPTIEVDLSQDIFTFSAGMSGDGVLLTVNGEELSAELFLYLLFWDCYYLEYNSYYYYGLTVDVGEAADALLEDTISMLQYYAVCHQKAAELGCLLTDEQRAELEAGKTGENRESYEQYKAAFGLTDESMDFLDTNNYYYENLMETIPMPAGDELDNYVYQTKHILLKTVDTGGTPGYNDDGEYGYPALDEETVAEKRALAEDILAQLRAVEGEEQLELFDKLMEEYSEDGRDSDGHISADGYEAVLGDMVPGYEQGALALDFGEISDIVESSYGYHIILRQEVEFRKATAEEYAQEYRAYLLEQQMDEWTDSAQVTRADALSGIDVASFYERYFAYHDAFIAQLEAAGGDGTD